MGPVSQEEAKKIISDLKRISKKFKSKIIICPPFTFLHLFKNFGNLILGAQDLFYEDPQKGSRPFTGEISASILKDFGVKYVIIGHSERRAMGESDETVNKKIKTALMSGLTPVVCVGEKERDQDGKFFEVLGDQIRFSLSKIKTNDLPKLIIAYEPVWAIGKSDKENIEGDNLHQMVIFIRKILSEISNKKIAFQVPIIYGGSVSSDDIPDLVSNGQIDGILPGRASLDPKEMKEILEALDRL